MTVIDATTLSSIHILDHSGDLEHKWDPGDPDSVSIAREVFAKAQKKKMLIYKVGRQGDREQIREFDPEAKHIVAIPQLQGG